MTSGLFTPARRGTANGRFPGVGIGKSATIDMPGATQIMALTARNNSLDALRGLAAALVLVTHASEIYTPMARAHGQATWLHDVALAIDIGRTGVVLFFLISGFAVASSLRQTADGVGRFAIRRFFRLYPLFWFSVLLAVVLFQPTQLPFSPAFAANLTMLPELLGFTQLLGIYWTLETEVISYAVAALLLVSGRFDSARWLSVLCGVLVLVFALMMFGVLPSAPILQWQMLPHNLAIILWGSLFHLVFNAQNAPSAMNLHRRTLTLLMAVVLLSPSGYALLQYALHGKPDNLRWGVAYPAAFAIFLTTFFWIKKVPPWLVWLGQISYSSYLLHVFAITLLSTLVQKSSLAMAWINLPLFVALALLATTLLASLTFVVVEKPAMQWGKALARRLRQ